MPAFWWTIFLSFFNIEEFPSIGQKIANHLIKTQIRHFLISICFTLQIHTAYITISVPVFPAMPSRALSNKVINALRPAAEDANSIAASILGNIEPGAN